MESLVKGKIMMKKDAEAIRIIAVYFLWLYVLFEFD